MDENHRSLSRRGVIAGMGAAVAGAAGAVLLPERAGAATHPLVARVPALRNTASTTPIITAERTHRLSGADFRGGVSGDLWSFSGTAITALNPAGQDFLAPIRPGPGEVITSVEVYVNPAGLGGDVALVRQGVDGTETPIVTATIPATSGFTTVTAFVPAGSVVPADPNTAAYALVVNVGQNAVLRGASVIAFANAGSLVLIEPQRVLDTRSATGGGRVATGEIRAFTVDTIVPRISLAALLNVTLDQTAGSGFLTVFAPENPDTIVAPPVSTVNWYTNNQIVANLAVSGMIEEADIYFTTGGPGSTHVIVDVLGYFA